MNHLKKRVVIAGGSGALGRALIAHLNDHGYKCVVLSRSGERVSGSIKSVKWLGEDRKWVKELDGALAVVNLSGENIGQRWTEENKKHILDSRVIPTRAIGDAIGSFENPPRMWINGSAVGIYGDTGDVTRAEDSPPGSGFMSETCKAWEAVVHAAPPAPTGRAIIRIGVVFDRNHGYIPTMIGMAKKGLGGRIGKGDQWLSWIHIDDLVSAIRFLIESERVGIFNACSPEPVQQKDFSTKLTQALDVPFAPPAPEFAVRIGAKAMGVEPEMIFASSRIVPNALLGDGFEFQFESVDAALADLIRR